MGFDPQCQSQHLFQGCGKHQQKAKSRRLSLKSETRVLIKDLKHEAHTYRRATLGGGRVANAGAVQARSRGSDPWAGSGAALPLSFAHSVAFLLLRVALGFLWLDKQWVHAASTAEIGLNHI